MSNKLLIVNADDFGMSPGISRGILHCLKNGIVSSTSVMVDNPYLYDTKELIKKNSQVDWGVHVTIGKSRISIKNIASETERQLRVFYNVFKIKPSHIDFHKGFKFNKKIYFALRMFAKKVDISFRYDNQHFIETRYHGVHENKPSIDSISTDHLIECLKDVRSGVTELICHPGWTSNRLTDPYRIQRNKEVEVLTSQRIKSEIRRRKIKLVTYKQYKHL